MEIVLKLTESLFALLLMGLGGFIAVRAGLVKSEESRPLSVLILYIMTPCTIIHACQTEISIAERKGFVFAFIVSAVIQILMVLIARALRKPLHFDPVEEASCVYSNCGNLILPLIQMTYGDDMVYLAIPYQITFNILLWTHCISLVREEKKADLKKILANPNIISIIAGCVMIFSGIRLPGVIDTAVESLGNMVGPGSMIVIGMTVASGRLSDVFTQKRAYIISALRLLVFPVMAMAILFAILHIPGAGDFTAQSEIVLLSAAAPVAATISQFAVIYNKNAAEAGAINILSTLLCIITMPLMIILFRSFIA